jgi:hypothetical protein
MYGTVGLLRDRRELLRRCHQKDTGTETQNVKNLKPLQKPLASAPEVALPTKKVQQPQQTPKE